MVRKMMKVGDRVSVYLNVPSDGFAGRITKVNDSVSTDIWYEVKPDGEGISGGHSFWHRESHVKKETV